MYLIELVLKLTPLPLSVQRKDLDDAKALYKQICDSIGKAQPSLLELTCEKMQHKKIAVLSSEILAVQLYEKTGASGGIKKPGFSFDN